MMKNALYAAVFTAAVWVGAGHLDAQGLNVKKLNNAPKIDGKLDDWQGATAVAMSDTSNVDDFKVENAYIAWDDKNLYVGVKVMDSKIVNDNPIEKMQAADSVELRLVTKNINIGSFFRIVMAPTTKDGKPAFCLSERDSGSKNTNKIVATTDQMDKSGVNWAFSKDDSSWTAEAAIPLSLLGIKDPKGKTIPFVLVVWDRDRSDINEWAEWHKRSESSSQKKPIDQWPGMVLE